MNTKCPSCHGQLIWDYENGEVVCSSCGYVVDRIYYYGPPRIDENEEIWREIRIKNNPRRNNIVRKYRYHYKLYREVESYVKDKPWLEVDYDKIFETGKMINTIKSKATLEAEKNIENKKLWNMINRGVEYIKKIHPIALARSSRGKYALAYIVASQIEKGKLPSLEEVVETFNISETSYRRLVKIAKEILLIKESIPN